MIWAFDVQNYALIFTKHHRHPHTFANLGRRLYRNNLLFYFYETILHNLSELSCFDIMSQLLVLRYLY